VSRLNVSLDTLKEDRFRHIIRLGRLKDVLEGIEAAKEASFGLVKINTVVMRGINEDEVLDFARMTCEDEWHIRFILTGARGTIGFISPLTETSFCSRCNRMRLTPDGRLRPCLLGEDELDLKTPLRNNASPEELRRLILKAVASKPEHHHLEVGNTTLMKRKMSQIGG
jgi:cyclic pyranopterin phosphate synthase